MRAWLFDTLATSTDLQEKLSYTAETARDKIKPRESATNLNIPKPYLVYGLGNATNEDLAEDPEHEASRQFFQIWIHDEGGDYGLIDEVVQILKDLLRGKSDKTSQVSQIRWLETSSEFSNETLNTIFRYVRFQAIISKGVLLT